jgi:hypothetical protein
MCITDKFFQQININMRFGTPADFSMDNGSPTTFRASGKASDLVVVTL